MLFLWCFWSIGGSGVKNQSYELNSIAKHEFCFLQPDDGRHLHDNLVVMRFKMLTDVSHLMGRPSWSLGKRWALTAITGVTVEGKGWWRASPRWHAIVIMSMDAFWAAELDFWCCFILLSMFGCCLVCFDEFWLINWIIWLI